QRATKIHVEHLETTADADHRLAARYSPVEQRPFGAVAVPRDLAAARVRRAVARRGNVSPAGKDQPVRAQRLDGGSRVRQGVRHRDQRHVQRSEKVDVRLLEKIDPLTGTVTLRDGE